MFKKFNTRELVFLALAGAILFMMDLFISSTIYALTGIPGLDYAIIAIFFVAIACVGGLVIRKFWAFTIMALIYALLAVPTIAYGPPGIYKIILALAVGLIIDFSVLIAGYKKVGYYIGLTIGNIASFLLFVLAFIILGFPGVEGYIEAIWLLSFIYGVEAIIGTWIGFIVYKKIKNKRVIKQISSF